MDEETIDLGSLELREVKYTLDGKKYVLREANGEAARQYRNAFFKAARVTDNKISGFDGIGDVEILLVSHCIFEVTEKGLSPVSKERVGAWPERIIKPLFAKAKEISDLDERPTTRKEAEDQIAKLQRQLGTFGEDPAKNSRRATTAGSA